MHGLLGGAIMFNAKVRDVGANEVTLDNGDRLTARCVIDGRGPSASPHLDLGFQKFVGLELRLEKPHGLATPTIMDADISQDDGYRFVYTLPFTDDTVLIEDTYYADGPALDIDAIKLKIADYAARRGWTIRETIRCEEGTLPILLGGDIDRFWADRDNPAARIGLRACLFHPTTGYSLPEAVRTADALVRLPELTTQSAAAPADGGTSAPTASAGSAATGSGSTAPVTAAPTAPASGTMAAARGPRPVADRAPSDSAYPE